MQLEGTTLWRETCEKGPWLVSETLSLPGLEWCQVDTRDIDMRKFVRHVNCPESPQSVPEIDARFIRFDFHLHDRPRLTKVRRRCPCRAPGASRRQYRDPATALSPRVPHRFYSRTRIGSSCEAARSAAKWPRPEGESTISLTGRHPTLHRANKAARTLSSSSSAGIIYRWFRLLHRLPLTVRKNRSWLCGVMSTICGGTHSMHIWC